MKSRALLWTLSGLFLAGCVGLFLPDNDSPRIVKFLILSQVLFALSVGIWWLGKKLDSGGAGSRVFLALVIVALVARVIMLVGAGDTFYYSDDIFRYIWDGKVNAHGINPFVYAPPAPELEHLRDTVIYPYINHPKVPTIYPPMAQNVFLVAYELGGEGTLAFKLICVLFELLTVAALMVWLKKAGVARSNVLLYLFSPLVLIEFYLSSHLDILAMPFLVTSLVMLRDKRSIVAGIALGLATMVKFYGLFFAPVVFFHLAGKDRWRFAAAYAGTIVLCYVPYVIGSDGLFLGSLFNYLSHWQFNGSIYFVLKYGLEISWSRYIVASAFVLWILWIIRSRYSIEGKLFRTYGGYLVLTPTFFPWYFVWIFPFAVKRISWAYLVLSSTVLLSYHVMIAFHDHGTWDPIIWLGVLAYLPFYALLIWALFNQDKVKD